MTAGAATKGAVEATAVGNCTYNHAKSLFSDSALVVDHTSYDG